MYIRFFIYSYNIFLKFKNTLKKQILFLLKKNQINVSGSAEKVVVLLYVTLVILTALHRGL
jgi:hypothetical protein